MQNQAKTQVTTLSIPLQERKHYSNNILSIGSCHSNYTVLDFSQAAGGKNVHCRKQLPFPKSCSGVATRTPKLCSFQPLSSDRNGGRIVFMLVYLFFRAHILHFFQTFLQSMLTVYTIPPCPKLKSTLYLIFSDFHCYNVIYGLFIHLMCLVTSLQDVVVETQLPSYSVSLQAS